MRFYTIFKRSKVEILRLLDKSDHIKEYQVTDYRRWTDGFYYKLKINFTDNSVLFAREYFDSTERSYSFHWQDENNRLVCRWDNAPHHKNIATFPHHKHYNDAVIESSEITIVEVLKYIHKTSNY